MLKMSFKNPPLLMQPLLFSESCRQDPDHDKDEDLMPLSWGKQFSSYHRRSRMEVVHEYCSKVQLHILEAVLANHNAYWMETN